MVIWSIPSKNDLKSIHDYIAIDSKFYAKKVISEIIEKSELLAAFPQMGRIVPEFEIPEIRELIVDPFRLIYEIKNEDCFVLAVIHSKMDLPNPEIKRV